MEPDGELIKSKTNDHEQNRGMRCATDLKLGVLRYEPQQRQRGDRLGGCDARHCSQDGYAKSLPNMENRCEDPLSKWLAQNANLGRSGGGRTAAVARRCS